MRRGRVKLGTCPHLLLNTCKQIVNLFGICADRTVTLDCQTEAWRRGGERHHSIRNRKMNGGGQLYFEMLQGQAEMMQVRGDTSAHASMTLGKCSYSS